MILQISCISVVANLWALSYCMTSKFLRLLNHPPSAKRVGYTFNDCIKRFCVNIHRQMLDVYGPNAMSDSKVRNWVRQFKNARENCYDEPRSGQPSLIANDLVTAVDVTFRENRRCTVNTLSMKCPPVLRSVLYRIVSLRSYSSENRAWGGSLISLLRITKRWGSTLTYLSLYDDEGDGMLNQIIVTVDETWVPHHPLQET